MKSGRTYGILFAKSTLLAVIVVFIAGLWVTGSVVTAVSKNDARDAAPHLTTHHAERSVPLSGNGTIVLDGVAGDVKVAAWKKPEVHIRVDDTLAIRSSRRFWSWAGKHGALNSSDAVQAYLKSAEIKVGTDEQCVTISAKQPCRRSGAVLTSRYEISVPSHAHVVIHAKQGSIVCTGVLGSVKAETGQGEISLRDVHGRLCARTSAGSITVRQNEGWGNGDSLVCTSLDGPIRIALPESSAFTLHVASLTGEFSSDFPITLDTPMGDTSFSAKVGAGGPRVAIDTLDGPVSLTRL